MFDSPGTLWRVCAFCLVMTIGCVLVHLGYGTCRYALSNPQPHRRRLLYAGLLFLLVSLVPISTAATLFMLILRS